ncbi:hypothetical protein ACGFJC_01145 [Nonomuraea fuscirosea]|uniref:hypothetical protein n=1 Tax=Nonomuraea fuscirosea TaxID=1291556 RepID=UPI0037114BA1
MMKRHLAIVATVAALGLGGMAGPALAGERPDGPVRVLGGHGGHAERARPDGHGERARHGGHAERARHGGRLVCWTDDGEVVRLSRAKVAELIDDEYVAAVPARAAEDDVRRATSERLTIRVPAREIAGGKVAGKRWRHARVIRLTCAWEGHVRR